MMREISKGRALVIMMILDIILSHESDALGYCHRSLIAIPSKALWVYGNPYISSIVL